jgi:hypothetical protein
MTDRHPELDLLVPTRPDDRITILSFPEFARCRRMKETRAAAHAYALWIAHGLKGQDEEPEKEF